MASSTCPYQSLPSTISGILSWDKLICSQDKSFCVVDRWCKNATNWQAIGSYIDLPKSTIELNLDGDGLSIDMSKAVFPDHLISLLLTNMANFKLSDTFKWPSNLTTLNLTLMPSFNVPKTWPSKVDSLVIRGAGLTKLPPIPSTVTALYLWNNSLSQSSEFQKLSNSLRWLSFGANRYEELSDLDWRHLDHLFLDYNHNLRRISNVSMSSKMLLLTMKNLRISSWIMDSATYSALNQLQPEREGPQGSSGGTYLVGYGHTNLTITTSESECNSAKGELKEIWDKKWRLAPDNTITYTVCVLPGVPSSKIQLQTTPAPTESGSGSIIGVVAGSIAGVIVVLALIGILLYKRRSRDNSRKQEEFYNLPQFPIDTNSDKLQTNMEQLAVIRLPDKDVKPIKVIGRGGFANVWLGTFNDEQVAIKKLHGNSLTAEQLESFIDEIKLLNTFNSPYIVQLIGVAWTRPADIKCVMEYMDSGDLRDYLDQHPPHEFEWKDKFVHIYSISEGIVYLHSQNIIHRDIKSRNVLMDSKKGTKLTDFGISKEDFETTMTMGVGTFRWMAPEVIKHQKYTIAADIYSFGMLLSEFDTHHIPYEDLKHESNGQPLGDGPIMVKVADGSLKPTFTADCPPWVHDLATECLQNDPADRPTAFQIAHKIRTQLREMSGGLFAL